MIEYTSRNIPVLLGALLDHIELVGLSLVISMPMAFVLFQVSQFNKIGKGIIYSLLLFIYCIPSIAFFCLLIPFFGLGKTSAVVGLVAYNQLLLIRCFSTSYNAISPVIREASAAMALTGWQKTIHIYLPIMLPCLIAGLRIATVSSTGICTMAALINAGGLGKILFEGMRMTYMPKIIWGILLIAGLAIILNSLFAVLENRALLRSHGYQPQ